MMFWWLLAGVFWWCLGVGVSLLALVRFGGSFGVGVLVLVMFWYPMATSNVTQQNKEASLIYMPISYIDMSRHRYHTSVNKVRSIIDIYPIQT